MPASTMSPKTWLEILTDAEQQAGWQARLGTVPTKLLLGQHETEVFRAAAPGESTVATSSGLLEVVTVPQIRFCVVK